MANGLEKGPGHIEYSCHGLMAMAMQSCKKTAFRQENSLIRQDMPTVFREPDLTDESRREKRSCRQHQVGAVEGSQFVFLQMVDIPRDKDQDSRFDKAA